MGVMTGAIGSHLLVLGIESAGDGGTLFILAIVVFVACLFAAILNLDQGKALLIKLTGKKS
jgi:apolipoprotein N-acyltransferase